MGTNAGVRKGCAKSEARNNARVAPIYMVGAPSRQYCVTGFFIFYECHSFGPYGPEILGLYFVFGLYILPACTTPKLLS